MLATIFIRRIRFCDSRTLTALQVSFHSLKNIRKCKVEKRSNEIVNRLNRTKREDNPDLAARREAYDQVKLVP